MTQSPNCRTDRHRACTGCDCTCHHVPPPPNLRALVEAAKPTNDEPDP